MRKEAGTVMEPCLLIVYGRCYLDFFAAAFLAAAFGLADAFAAAFVAALGAGTRFSAVDVFGFTDDFFAGGLGIADQRYSGVSISPSSFLRMKSVILSTIQLWLYSPTEASSASGAGFMKSMAYGMPSLIANSTVFRS